MNCSGGTIPEYAGEEEPCVWNEADGQTNQGDCPCPKGRLQENLPVAYDGRSGQGDQQGIQVFQDDSNTVVCGGCIKSPTTSHMRKTV